MRSNFIRPSSPFLIRLRNTSSNLPQCSYRLLVTLACVLCLTAGALAQDKQYTENKPDQALKSDIRVDPSTLGMSISVLLGGAAGRAGTSLPISLRYSSKLWRIKYAMSWQSYLNLNTWTRAEFSESSVAGWSSSLEPPRIEFTGGMQSFDENGSPTSDDPDYPSNTFLFINRLHVHMPDGSSHEMRKDDQPQTQYDPTGMFYAVDGSQTRYDADAGVLYLPDGGRYFFGPQQTVWRYQGQMQEGRWATSYVDRNGNTLTYNSSNRTWTDTLGRSYANPLPDNPSVGDQPYSVPGVGTNTVTYTLRWRLLSDALSTPGEPLRYTSNRRCVSPNQYQTLSPYLFNTSYPVHICADNQVFNPVVLSEIVLPTGQSYQYKYNVYGEIDKVRQPGGGYERFRYAQVATLGDASHPYDQANRGVVEHWVSPSGNGSEESTHYWQYSITGVVNGTYVTATMTAPDGTRTERLIHASGGVSDFGFNNALSGMTYDERIYNPANQMLRRTLTQWSTTTYAGSNGRPRNPHVTKTVSLVLDTGGNALAATTEMHYDSDLNVDWTKKYDYASVASTTAQTAAIGSIPSGALLRIDETTYLVNDSSISASIRQSYRDRNLIGLPSSSRVKNAAGTVVAQSEFKYDEAAYPILTYPTVTGWTDPGTNVRANATTARNWLDTTNTWLETHAQYDQTGNARKSWDAKGNLSQVEYADRFYDNIARNTYAYPTRALSAVPDPTNSRGTNTPLEALTTYDFNTGKVRATTDANNKTTTYQYNDVLGGLTDVSRPDGGWTSYWYDRNAYGDYIGTRTAINASQHTESYQFFDGLGRSVRSFQLAGSQWITADTQYDALGRVWRVSNPYLSGGSGTPINPSGNWTTTAYDALGRIATVTTPDSAVATSSYSGNSVTVTDQVGRGRRSVTDTLGRLSAVYEDPAGANYLTSYTYDVLGNLRQVNQGGQMRYFMYDSLSRVVRAKNPEQVANPNLATSPDSVTGNTQWSLAYAYDANGNISSKTDARGVTLTYQYDGINRNTTFDYSDTASVNPDVMRFYDGAVNGRGRFWYNYKAESQTWEHTAIDGYDAMGRAYQQRQAFHTSGVWSSFYYISRSYDRMGHVTTQTYPSGHTVTYSQFDVAGRLKHFAGNLGDGVTRTYATNISYDEAGRPNREQFGTQIPLYHKQRYNVRGQMWDVRLSTVDDADNWNRGMVVNSYGSGDFVQWGTSGTNNNGNVLRSHHYIPADDQVSNWTVNYQDYTYDSLNRLTSVSERRQFNGGSDTAQYAQVYDYDPWGNRQINSAQTSDNLNEKQFTIDAATNRLGVPSGQVGALQYDAAGNLTTDSYTGAGARTYDAENRMTSAQIGINSSATYTYDAEGRRVRRSTPNGTVWQVYGIDGELLAEYAASAAPSAPQKEYGYRSGELLITAESAGQVNWLVADHLGTPRMIADQTGNLVGIKRHDYLPFGEEIGAGIGGRTTSQGYSEDNVRQKFTEYERDIETKLDYA